MPSQEDYPTSHKIARVISFHQGVGVPEHLVEDVSKKKERKICQLYFKCDGCGEKEDDDTIVQHTQSANFSGSASIRRTTQVREKCQKSHHLFLLELSRRNKSPG
jgi:hypothetical protein